VANFLEYKDKIKLTVSYTIMGNSKNQKSKNEHNHLHRTIEKFSKSLESLV